MESNALKQKLVILKADDLGFNPGMSSFRRLIEIANRRRLPLSIGAISSRLSFLKSSEVHYLRACFEDPLYELWNHSHTHPNFVTLTYEKQLHEITQAQKILHDMLGVQCKSFGAPYNKYNEDTMAALHSCAELEAVYLLEPPLAATSRLVNAARATLLSPEFVRPHTRQNDFPEFVRRCKILEKSELLTVQFHPTAWNDYGFEQYERCLDYLLEQGARFITLGDYAALQKARATCEALPEQSTRLAAILTDSKLDNSARALRNKYADERRLSDFFFNRHILGTQHVLRAFEKINFDSAPELRGNHVHACLDIGCGAGNWLIGYGLQHPQALLRGIDSLAPCVEIATTQLAAAGMADRTSILHASVEQASPFPEQFSRIWCINAGQYMNKEKLFGFVQKVLKYQGNFFLSLQTADYFLCNAWQRLNQLNSDPIGAAASLETIIGSAAQRLGIHKKISTVHAYNQEEIAFCAKHSGFAMVIEGVQPEDMPPAFRGHAMMKAYLLENNALPLTDSMICTAFLALPNSEREQHLSALCKYGMWGMLKILIEGARAGIPESTLNEITALSQSVAGVAFGPQNSIRSEGFSRTTRAVLSINNGDYQAPALEADANKQPELIFLKSLSCYLRGDFHAAMRVSTQASDAKPFDERLAVLFAAAACKAGIPKAAMEMIDIIYEIRSNATILKKNAFMQWPWLRSQLTQGSATTATSPATAVVSEPNNPPTRINLLETPWLEFSSLEQMQLPLQGTHQLRIQSRGVPFEMLYKTALAPDSLIVFGQSALGTRNNMPLPLYHRWTWFDDFPNSACIALNDPSLYLSDELLGGWFQGTSEHFYMEDAAGMIAEIARQLGIPASRVFFYGSSAGGFSSLMMAAELTGATAIAEIPQTDMAKYHVLSAVDALRQYCYKGMELDQIIAEYGDRISVLKRFQRLGNVPNIIYLQNVADTLHLENHVFPFLSGAEELFKDSSQKNERRIMLELYCGRTDKGDGHVAAPKHVAVRAIHTAMKNFS